MATERVAILVIGNEILSGDTHEGNAHFMARRLAGRGIPLGRIVVIPDDVAEIARHVAELAAEFDVVVSCGGIGPTHDDVTMCSQPGSHRAPGSTGQEPQGLFERHTRVSAEYLAPRNMPSRRSERDQLSS